MGFGAGGQKLGEFHGVDDFLFGGERVLAGHLLRVDHSSGGDFEAEGAPAFLVRGARHFIGAQILEIEGSAHGELFDVGGPEAVDAVVDMAADVVGVVAGEGVGGKGVGGEGVAFEAESFVDLAEVIADLGVERGAPGRFDDLLASSYLCSRKRIQP